MCIYFVVSKIDCSDRKWWKQSKMLQIVHDSSRITSCALVILRLIWTDDGGLMLSSASFSCCSTSWLSSCWSLVTSAWSRDLHWSAWTLSPHHTGLISSPKYWIEKPLVEELKKLKKINWFEINSFHKIWKVWPYLK